MQPAAPVAGMPRQRGAARTQADVCVMPHDLSCCASVRAWESETLETASDAQDVLHNIVHEQSYARYTPVILSVRFPTLVMCCSQPGVGLRCTLGPKYRIMKIDVSAHLRDPRREAAMKTIARGDMVFGLPVFWSGLSYA
jgi:hypothetical protein